MGYILMLLFAVIDKEKKGSTNYIIAHYILNHLGSRENFSVTSIAKACNVSKASVSRFCRCIGLQDFLDLQILIKSYVSLTEHKFHYQHQNSHDLRDYVKSVTDKINQFNQNIDIKIILELVHDIHRYEKVSFLGMMQSGHILMNLQDDLASLRKFVYCTTDAVRIKDTIVNANENDLIIIFSARGYFFDIILPRIRILDKNHYPKIYFVTTNQLKKSKFVYKNIILDTNYNYSSSTILFQLLSNMIALEYYNRYEIE